MDNDKNLPAKAGGELDTNLGKSKNLWIIGFSIMLLLVMYLKHAHLALPGLGWDAGLVFVLGLFFVGLFTAMFCGFLQGTTQILIAEGKFKLAEKGLRKGISWHRKLGPLSADCVNDLIRLSLVCRETGQFADAEQFAREALTVLSRIEAERAKPTDEPTTARGKQLDAIAKEFNKRTMALYPDALFELAATQYELGKLSDAERSLKDSLKTLRTSLDQYKNPTTKLIEDDESWLTKDFVLASMQKENNSSDKVLQILDRIATAERLLAKIYQRQGQGEQAESALRKSDKFLRQCIDFLSSQIAADQEKPDHYFHRASSFLKVGDHKRAIADLNRVLELKPPKALEFAAVCNRGECYNRLGQHEVALQDFSRALLIRPKNGLALMNRADVYEKLGKRELGADDTQKAIAYGYSKERLDLFSETPLLNG